jgi:hypothetical protein
LRGSGEPETSPITRLTIRLPSRTQAGRTTKTSEPATIAQAATKNQKTTAFAKSSPLGALEFTFEEADE